MFLSSITLLVSLVVKILFCRYQCIENELLYPLQRATHNIAPYKSKGLERATELSVCWDSDQSLRSTKNNNEGSCARWDLAVNGIGTKIITPLFDLPPSISFCFPLQVLIKKHTSNTFFSLAIFFNFKI